MPEKDYKLTDAERDRALTWFNKYFKPPKCSICGAMNWQLTEYFVQFQVFTPGAFIIGGTPVIPVFLIVCKDCGLTHTISALTTGVLKIEDVEPAKSKETEVSGIPPEQPKEASDAK